jgi:hypothetical protein
MFKFIPSGVFSPDVGGLGMWVRYGNTGQNHVSVLERSNTHCRFRAPDREVLMVMDANREDNYRPLGCNYDEFVSLSPLNACASEQPVRDVMLNYPQHLAKMDQSPRTRRAGSLRRDGVHVLADSGGYQLYSGKVSYVDPEKTQLWYNDNVDTGIVIDIPAPFKEDDIVVASARVQRSNTEIMMSVKDEYTDLMNVFHGMSPKYYDMFRDIVEVDGIDKVCIADGYRGSIMRSVADVLHVITTGRGYEQYHLLGLYNTAVLPIFVKMSHMGFCPLITSDASTHIQAAMGRMYMIQRTPMHGVERIPIGIDGKTKFSSAHRLLTCSCPVCSRLKYTDILAYLPGAISSFTFYTHNMYEIDRYVKMLDGYAAELSSEDYAELIGSQLRNHNGRDTALRSLRFLDLAREEGLATARKKFSYYLDYQDKGMFKSSHVSDILGDSVPQEEGDDDARNRVWTAIRKYQEEGAHRDHQKLVSKKARKKQGIVETPGGAVFNGKAGAVQIKKKVKRLTPEQRKNLKVKKVRVAAGE